MVSTVGDGRVHNSQSKPQPGNREVGPHDDWAQGYWEIVGENLFHRVAIAGGYSSWCRPLMVCLVNVFVETRVMEEPVKRRGEGGERRGKGGAGEREEVKGDGRGGWRMGEQKVEAS